MHLTATALSAALLFDFTSALACPRGPIVGPPQGALVVVGGGTLGDSIFQEVITRAGGGPIVVVPTAGGAETYDQNATTAPRFRDLGALKVTVVHTLDPEIADTDEFVKPILEAGGLWFDGGRQWQLVDAYAGTKAEAAFRTVLERGGVIGGTSAGASIQASFLVRGDTSSNDVLIGDHTVGFGYLRNVAVDQHILVRDRQFDMPQILKVHPELLGFGCDEKTAVVVVGDSAHIIGTSYCAFYDGGFFSRDGTGGKVLPPKDQVFYFLRAGDKYDLAARKVTFAS